MSNIKDVAKTAGVSIASVSRVLNNRGYISESLRNKVYTAIKEIDYHPNEMARNFQQSRTKIIGLIIPDIQHLFFSTITRYIEKELRDNDYKLLLCNAMNSENLEQNYINMLRNNQVDGIIIGSHTLEIEKYLKINLPIVALDREFESGIPVISADHYEGGLLAARELMISGCKTIVQVSAFEGSHLVCNQRHIALQKYFDDRSISCKTFELNLNEFDYASYKELAGKILDQENPDGVFAEDIVASAFIKEAIKRCISIPKDLKIVGYDGTIISNMITPSMTTILQPFEQIAHEIVKNLLSQINGNKDYKLKVLLPTQLIKGETT